MADRVPHVLDEIARNLPLLVAWADRDCRFHFANERYAALFGRTPETIRGMTIREFYGEAIWNRIEGHVLRALAGERVDFDVNDPALEDPCLFRVTYVPDRGDDGEVRGFFLSLYDVKEVRRAERASAFLAQASHILAGTLDDRRVLDEITRLAVPRLADWCFVDIVDGDGGMRRVAVAHPADADPTLVRRHYRYFPPKEVAFTIVSTVRSGQPALRNDVDDALLQAIARDDEHLEILRGVAMRSFISVPLTARERTFGAITFVRTKAAYSAHDLEITTDLARRVALAIDNNRLYADAQEANRAKDEFLATLSHTVAVDGGAAAPVTGDRVRLEQVVWNLLANAVKFSADEATVRVAGAAAMTP